MPGLLGEWRDDSSSWAQMNGRREGEGAKLSSVAPVTRDNQTSRIAERTKSANIDIETAKTAGENTGQRRNGIENIPVTYLHESGLQREAKRSVLERPVLQTDT